MAKILNPVFFNRPTSEVARDLLGKFLTRKLNGKVIARIITEVEVYDGFDDKGSHARNGKTSRNWAMFGGAGRWYVYFTYGMHWMLNIVTREEDYPAAVLIRGIEDVQGPGRLTKFLKINGGLTGRPSNRKTGLWIEDRGWKIKDNFVYPPSPRLRRDDFQQKLKIKKGPRIGIEHAGPYWAKRHLRFWINTI